MRISSIACEISQILDHRGWPGHSTALRFSSDVVGLAARAVVYPIRRRARVPVVRRTGQPERVGGTDLLPVWRATLSGEPDAAWRRRFARAAHIDGLFAGRKIVSMIL